MTDLARHDAALAEAPTDPVDLARLVQGVLIHPMWASAYDVHAADRRRVELQARGATAILDGILRRAGTPARARCGFAGSFEAGKCVDHWIIEHRNGDRWIALDAQLDDLQREVTGVTDATDLAADRFLPAGEAWQRCRTGDWGPCAVAELA